MQIKHIFLIILFFSLSVLCFSQQKDQKSIINIESAQKSEYKKDASTGDDSIVLTGQVKISVTKGSNKTTIQADKVNYNRASEMLFAEGNVKLEQSDSSSGGEEITADSLLFNTSTLEGIFDNGRAVQTSSDAINLPSGSTLIVASDIFGRDSGGTIAFKGGELTFCDDENPHWKIKASRIWLLPGGEFAFLNALLYVGRVPLLYLPAFYYPKDELIFNPAMGYKFREGYFINTTTYLYGRKPEDAASTSDGSSSDDEKIDLFSFMKTGGLKEQVREGIVLHNLDEDYKGETTNHVKVMADYYANLGAMIGTDFVFKPDNSFFNDIQFNLELGFSNTVFKNSYGYYVPYNTNNVKVSDKSNFMGIELPFRYQANLNLVISKPLSLTLSMPLYSDPYFNYDFNNRAETMDWIDFLMSGAATEDEEDVTLTDSFQWSLKGSYTFSIPDNWKPYVSSISLSEFSSSVDFGKKETSLGNDSRYSEDSAWASYSPERYFYYPNKINPLKISARISGTIFQFPASTTTAKQTTTLTLIPPDDINPNKTDESAVEKKSDEEGDNSTDEDQKDIAFAESALPVISTVSASVKNLTGISYKLAYSISPDFSSQISYASSKLSKPEDFDWKIVNSTYIEAKSPTTLTSTLGYKDSFLSLTDTFSFNPVYQVHPYLNTNTEQGGFSESYANQTKTSDYNARKLDLTDTNALTFKPFYYTQYFSNTALTWNTTVKMIQTKYISDDVNNPEWEYLTMDLTDKDCVTTHNLNLVLSATEGDYSQKLSLTTTLPPQVDSYTGVFSLTFPYSTFSIGTGVRQKSATDDAWVKNDISQSFSLKLFNSKFSLTQSYVYDWEESEHDSFKFSLSGFGTQLAYTMSYTNDYIFEIERDTNGNILKRNGWKSTSEKSFQPYSLSFAYTSTSKTFKYWTERISWSPSLSTSFVYDFIRPTSSYFVFIPKLTFKVNDFLDFSFSVESRNSVIYRYFCSESNYEYYYDGNGQRNIFDDLVDSFRFDSDTKRRESGFKLKSLAMSITHDLHDWDLNCSLKISPRYVAANSTTNTKAHYDFSPYFSLSVSWRPMAGMKTEIEDEYGTWNLN